MFQERKGKEGKGREGKGREGKGREEQCNGEEYPTAGIEDTVGMKG